MSMFEKGFGSSNVEIYSSGASVDAPDVSERARNELQRIHSQFEQGKEIFLFFDLDGVLVEAGVGTDATPKTLSQFESEKTDAISTFFRRIGKMKNLGFKVAINTGRGAVFSKRIRDDFFPAHSVDAVVCEGGALVISEDEAGHEIRTIPKSVDGASASLLELNKEKIINHILGTIGGSLESGKETVLSFNPPERTGIESYFRQIADYLESTDLASILEISHSATAVDITPRGADKLSALSEVLGENMAVYFGDARSDEDPMRISVGSVVPANGMESTKEQAKQSTFGLLTRGTGIEGVNEALRRIEAFWRLARNSKG